MCESDLWGQIQKCTNGVRSPFYVKWLSEFSIFQTSHVCATNGYIFCIIEIDYFQKKYKPTSNSMYLYYLIFYFQMINKIFVFFIFITLFQTAETPKPRGSEQNVWRLGRIRLGVHWLQCCYTYVVMSALWSLVRLVTSSKILKQLIKPRSCNASCSGDSLYEGTPWGSAEEDSWGHLAQPNTFRAALRSFKEDSCRKIQQLSLGWGATSAWPNTTATTGWPTE